MERLEQTYRLLRDEQGRPRFQYATPAFEFSCELRFDTAGLMLDYPGLGRRAR